MAVRRILTVLALTGLASAQNPWVNRRKNKDKDWSENKEDNMQHGNSVFEEVC